MARSSARRSRAGESRDVDVTAALAMHARRRRSALARQRARGPHGRAGRAARDAVAADRLSRPDHRLRRGRVPRGGARGGRPGSMSAASPKPTTWCSAQSAGCSSQTSSTPAIRRARRRATPTPRSPRPRCVIDATYTTPAVHHAAMEPHAALAMWNQGSLTIYDTSQGASFERDALAELFGLEPGQVRVISEYVGGGFGSKGFVCPHAVAAALAALAVGRPVKLALTRQQTFAIAGYRTPTIQRLRIGAARRWSHRGTRPRRRRADLDGDPPSPSRPPFRRG